jgi:CheY-like chemotaxis protein
MRTSPRNILIVDDNALLRNTLSMIFTHSGYRVRCAGDGFSALAEIRCTMPEILLSDLNMPGMSGFELLSVVRRRFPEIRVIAMSGAFEEDHLPASVAADEFYRKGRGPGALLALANHLYASTQPRARAAETPIWISGAWSQGYDAGHIAIACPECLRVFPKLRGDSNGTAEETRCSHCSTSVRLAFVRPVCETDMTSIGFTAAN